jgi:hypothetical protein
MKQTFFLFTLTLLLAIPLLIYSHEKSMIEDKRPSAPATINPGPEAALVRISVIDAQENQTTSATISVNNGAFEPENNPYNKFGLRQSANRHKGPIRFRPLNYYFYSNGYSEVKVLPGNVTLEIQKGYEYLPRKIQLYATANDTLDIDVQLEKILDMESLGWYCGDTHIHMDRTGFNDDTLMTITSAKNIRYAYLLSMNTTGYDMGKKYESWLQEKGLGDRSVFKKGPYFLVSGQEYRTRQLGHVTIIMPDEYVPGIGSTKNVDKGPSMATIADQTHEKNGYIGLAHGGYTRMEADGLLLEDKMDFIELLQFGDYRNLGLDGWYDFLNIGFRIPIVGACDYPYTRELGSEITYVWSDQAPTPRTFAQNVAEGKSFASTGPLLFLNIEKNKPGDIQQLPAGTDTTLSVHIKIKSPIYPVRDVEFLVNGKIVKHVQYPELQENVELFHQIRINKSCWIAARTYAKAGTEAHTNPIYFYVGKELPFNRDSARQIMARLEGSIETIANKQVTRKLVRLKSELANILEEKDSALPFPEINPI